MAFVLPHYGVSSCIAALLIDQKGQRILIRLIPLQLLKPH